MAPRGYVPMSPLSAAVPLLQWIEMHGREPHWREYCPSQGLPYATTYFRSFGVSSLSLVLAQAYALATEPPAVVKTKPCLDDRCRQLIPDEGHHIRFCTDCRTAMNKRQTLESWVEWEPRRLLCAREREMRDA
jgi:hypothetical protein